MTLELLRSGEMEVLGLLPYASNATLLAKITNGTDETLAVYKPRRGERPLWDFPDGTLCHREYAAWLVDQATGWGLVPSTVLRDGPAGFGAVQIWIDEDDTVDVRSLGRTHLDALRRIALFDVVVNNADRKAGHLLVDTSSRLWSVDHGICFAAEPKLRTVIWAFEGEQIDDELLSGVEALRASSETFAELAEHLTPSECEALCRRAEHVLQAKRFPSPEPGERHVPWPPW